jgi:hypothetical protein
MDHPDKPQDDKVAGNQKSLAWLWRLHPFGRRKHFSFPFT